jgi:hypothetical protein
MSHQPAPDAEASMSRVVAPVPDTVPLHWEQGLRRLGVSQGLLEEARAERAIQHPAKDNSKKTSGGFKDLLKEKCLWHLKDYRAVLPTPASTQRRTRFSASS